MLKTSNVYLSKYCLFQIYVKKSGKNSQNTAKSGPIARNFSHWQGQAALKELLRWLSYFLSLVIMIYTTVKHKKFLYCRQSLCLSTTQSISKWKARCWDGMMTPIKWYKTEHGDSLLEFLHQSSIMSGWLWLILHK